MRRLYRRRYKDAENRNIFWNLTIEQFHKLTSANCSYCDRPPEQVARKYVYNGIDRVDNEKGYTPQNSVPCCKECNYLKRDMKINFSEMRAVAQALKKHRATAQEKAIQQSSELLRETTSPSRLQSQAPSEPDQEPTEPQQKS